MKPNAREAIADEVMEIMQTYREQMVAGFVDTPGGLEHMGDVWKMLARWDGMLQSELKTGSWT